MLLILLALLAGWALFISQLPQSAALLLWLAAIGHAGWQWRRLRRYAGVELWPPDRVLLRGPEGEREADWRGCRRWGPWLLLEVEHEHRCVRLPLFSAGLSLNARRELGRALARMRPVGVPSV